MSETLVEKIISADEARKLAKESNWLINHIMKEIRYQAGQNHNRVRWCIEDCEPSALESAKNQLKASGYKIKTDDEDENTIYIIW